MRQEQDLGMALNGSKIIGARKAGPANTNRHLLSCNPKLERHGEIFV